MCWGIVTITAVVWFAPEETTAIAAKVLFVVSEVSNTLASAISSLFCPAVLLYTHLIPMIFDTHQCFQDPTQICEWWDNEEAASSTCLICVISSEFCNILCSSLLDLACNLSTKSSSKMELETSSFCRELSTLQDVVLLTPEDSSSAADSGVDDILSLSPMRFRKLVFKSQCSPSISWHLRGITATDSNWLVTFLN